jgi:hypothetical protein
MNKKASLSVVTASAILLFTGPIGAEEFVQTFEQIDVNGDGYISVEEAEIRADVLDNLEAIDENGDGRLNSAEFSAFEAEGRFTTPEESEVSEPGAAPF